MCQECRSLRLERFAGAVTIAAALLCASACAPSTRKGANIVRAPEADAKKAAQESVKAAEDFFDNIHEMATLFGDPVSTERKLLVLDTLAGSGILHGTPQSLTLGAINDPDPVVREEYLRALDNLVKALDECALALENTLDVETDPAVLAHKKQLLRRLRGGLVSTRPRAANEAGSEVNAESEEQPEN